MKYTLTLLGILIVLASQAQSAIPEWHYGLKADLNYTTINGKGLASGYTMGAQAGAFVERSFNKNWSLQPEILFTQSNTQKGNDFLTYYNTTGNPFAAKDIKLGYLSIPVMIKYNINKSFSILAGPQYSLLLVDAESLLTAGDGKAFKKSEVSANLGGQFTIGIISIYGRYNLGINNINNIDNRYAWHSSHIQAGIAVKIN
jgi:hypothetical protein